MYRPKWIGLLFTILWFTGCQFATLKQEAVELEKFLLISGEIQLHSEFNKPIVVVLYTGSVNDASMVDIALARSGKFNFWTYPGEYYIAAFHDENQDFEFQKGEQYGYHGEAIPEKIKLKPNISLSSLTIKLSKNAELLQFWESELSSSPDYSNLWPGVKNFGKIVSLNDAMFSQKNARMALWQPLKFSLTVGSGIYFMEEYDPAKIPVVFVHGIGGTPRDWQSVIESIDRTRYQPWLLFYGSGFALELSAHYLFEALDALYRYYEFEELYLVAHSMGGLLSRGAINRYKTSQENYIRLFISMATPWKGQEAASLGVKYAPQAIPVWRDLVPGSQFLSTLYEQPMPGELPHYLLFAYRGRSLIIPGEDDGVISISSQLAIQHEAHKVYGFDVSHENILKDKSVNSTINQIFEQLEGK